MCYKGHVISIKQENMSIVKNYVKIFIDKNYPLKYIYDVNLTQQSRLN